MPSQPRHAGCGTCSTLHDSESATQYVHQTEPDTHLPEAVGRLRDVPTRSGSPDLMVCPECGTYYSYTNHYEFLIGFGGSYDEQTVTRLSDQEAAELLGTAAPTPPDL